MNPQSSSSIWRYLDGELSPDERIALEKACFEVEGVRRDWLATKTLHRQLHWSIQHPPPTDDQVADLLCRWYDQDESASHLIHRRVLHNRPLRFTTYLLATAACLLIGVGITDHVRGPIRWEKSSLATSFRDQTEPSRLDQTKTREVKKSLATAFRQQSSRDITAWIWKTKARGTWNVALATTASGAILLQLEVNNHGEGFPPFFRERLFISPNEFDTELAAWASVVVSEFLSGEPDR